MTDRAGLAGHIEAFSRSTVLCVGDLMLDRFVYGGVTRISPEAPIPVIRVEDERAMLGGAGNVVHNLVTLGARCTFVSVIGADPEGHELAAMVGAEGGVEAYLLTEPDRPSTVKTRYIAGGQQLLRADRETDRPLSEAVANDLTRAACDAVDACDAVILSDYGKGVISDSLAAALIERARAAGKPVVVDPKGTDFGCYRGASVVTPNRHELAAASGMATASDDDVVAAARKLIDECGVEAILVTRGQDGMSLVTAGDANHVSALAREVFDVSGAGDTVVAVFAAAIGAGVPRLDAVALANVAAGIVVGRLGTAAVFGAELLSALHTSDVLSSDAKVAPAALALDKVSQWRQRGERIAFTNGCFDLLHPGHLSLLRQAAAQADRLVVGLNSDASAGRLKGPDRPVQGEAARALVLASLEAVDLVVIFDDDTPLALIEALRPEILVKGADYKLENVVGAELVQGYGGAVVLAKLEPGFSTTETIARLVR
jgi:D-beta-D-heptose 7-phosphate kinase/D-beta-D-heptose 1-phosphate adenosyltransferase